MWTLVLLFYSIELLYSPPVRGAHGSESPVSVLEIIEPEPNREDVILYFAVTVPVPKTVGFSFSSEPAVFRRFFCGSDLISRFFGGFSRFRFGTIQNRRFRHSFGSKFFEPEPNHGSKIDGFGSDKFSPFRFRTVTADYDFGFNSKLPYFQSQRDILFY